MIGVAGYIKKIWLTVYVCWIKMTPDDDENPQIWNDKQKAQLECFSSSFNVNIIFLFLKFLFLYLLRCVLECIYLCLGVIEILA